MHSTTQAVKNQICISRTLFDEGMRATENKAYKKTLRTLALILLALYLTVAVWLFCNGGSLLFLFGETIFLGALLFWLIIILPGKRRRSKYKAMVQDSSGLPKRSITFYPNHLSVITDTGKETSIPTADVIGWQETKNLYILSCKNNVYILLDKNGFVTGDFPAVKSLLFGE